MSSAFVSRSWLTAVGVAAVLFLLAGVYLGPRPFDDSFISYRFATNVAHGYGLVYNTGEPVFGTTAPLWAFVLAGVSQMGPSIPAAAFFWSLLLALARGLMMFALLRRLACSEGVAASTVILFFGLFDFLSIVRSGMETSLFVCLLLLTLYAGLTRYWVLAGPSAFFLCLTRPEGLLVLVVLAAQFGLGRRQNDAADRGKALVGVLILTVLATAWLVWTCSYYGSVIPQTVRTKAYFAAHNPSLHTFSWHNFSCFSSRASTAVSFSSGLI